MGTNDPPERPRRTLTPVPPSRERYARPPERASYARIDPDESLAPNAGVRAVVVDSDGEEESTPVVPPTPPATPPATGAHGVHPLEIRRGIVVDTVAIIALSIFAVMALYKDHEGAAMAAIMAIPHIVGVRTALRTAGAVATSQSGTGAIVAMFALGLAKIAGRH